MKKLNSFVASASGLDRNCELAQNGLVLFGVQLISAHRVDISIGNLEVGKKSPNL